MMSLLDEFKNNQNKSKQENEFPNKMQRFNTSADRESLDREIQEADDEEEDDDYQDTNQYDFGYWNEYDEEHYNAVEQCIAQTTSSGKCNCAKCRAKIALNENRTKVVLNEIEDEELVENYEYAPIPDNKNANASNRVKFSFKALREDFLANQAESELSSHLSYEESSDSEEVVEKSND
jgi:cobalamin biosynthesis Mg chelatase CobN